MNVSEKQKNAIELIFDPTLTELLIGGSGGGSKTYTICLAAVLLCKKYPGIKIAICRKTNVQLRRTTIATLLTNVHPDVGMTDADAEFKAQISEVWYKNGSKILFLELDTVPSDPDFAKLGSLEIDVAMIDEAGEITLAAKNALKSRIGRGKISQKLKLPGTMVVSCNPSQNFLRQEYYEPYEKLGGGEFQKWQIGYTYIDGEKVPAYRGYLRMSVYDNPFINEAYIENLKTLPPREKKRLLDGDWNYADDDNSLFESILLDKATIYEIPEIDSKTFSKFIGADIADKGKDETIITLIDNGVITTQKALKVDTSGEKPISLLLADELIKFAQQNGFTPAVAKHIAVEGNGVGVGIRDALRARGWYISVYTANSKSRSEGYYQMKLDMDSGDLKILHGLDDGIFRRELAAHTYEMENQVPKVAKKDKIKQALGRSPDRADSGMIANWSRNQKKIQLTSTRIRF